MGAPYFDGAKLLVAADCTAYAYARMHEQFMRRKVTLIGCPKLDAVDYSEKLTQILRTHEIRSVTVVRMEVPCCGGLEFAVKTALQNCGKLIPWQTVTISVDGKILTSKRKAYRNGPRLGLSGARPFVRAAQTARHWAGTVMPL